MASDKDVGVVRRRREKGTTRTRWSELLAVAVSRTKRFSTCADDTRRPCLWREEKEEDEVRRRRIDELVEEVVRNRIRIEKEEVE